MPPAKLPTKQVLGESAPSAGFNPSRINLLDLRAIGDAGDHMEKGFQSLGKGLGKAVVGAHDMMTKGDPENDQIELATANADFAVRESELRSKLTQDPDYASAPQRYREGMEAIHSETAGKITNPKTRELYFQRQRVHVENGYRGIESWTRQRDGEVKVADTDKQLDALGEQALRVTTPEERNRAIEAGHEQVDALVAARHLTPSQGAAKKKAWVERYATAAVNAMTPSQRLEEHRKFQEAQKRAAAPPATQPEGAGATEPGGANLAAPPVIEYEQPAPGAPAAAAAPAARDYGPDMPGYFGKPIPVLYRGAVEGRIKQAGVWDKLPPALREKIQDGRGFTKKDIDDLPDAVWAKIAPEVGAPVPKAAAPAGRTLVDYKNETAIRSKPLDRKLELAVQSAVSDVYGPGYKVVVYSGGQPKPGQGARTGTTRHDEGRAGDMRIVGPDGKVVQGEDLERLGQYWLAKKYGGVGIGMANGGIHLDMHTERAPLWGYNDQREAVHKSPRLQAGLRGDTGLGAGRGPQQAAAGGRPYGLPDSDFTAPTPDDKAQSVAVRMNNPGNQWSGESSRLFGATRSANVSSTDQPAVFPDRVSGAAAMFHLLGSNKYAGKTVEEAIYKWAGGRKPDYPEFVEKTSGVPRGTVITPEFLKTPEGIAVAKAMARWEAGYQKGEYPLSEQGWSTAQKIAFDENARKEFYSGGGQQQQPVQVAQVRSGTLFDFIPADKREILIRRAEQESVVHNEAEKAEVRQLVGSSLMAVRNHGEGVPVDTDRIAKALGPAEAAKYTEALEVNRRVYIAEQGLIMLPRADIEKQIEALRPTSSLDPEYKRKVEVMTAVRKTADAIIKQRDEDPASAALEIPMVRQAVEQQDPRVPESVERAQQVLLGAQEAMGIPADKRSVITNAQAEQLAAPLEKMMPGQHARVFKELGAAIAERYPNPEIAGRVWEQVIHGYTKKEETARAAGRIYQQITSGQMPTRQQLQDLNVARDVDASKAATGTDKPGVIESIRKGWAIVMGGSPAAAGGTKAAPEPPKPTGSPPPARAIRDLRADPKLAPAFDKEYGKGWADHILKTFKGPS
jgi:hypothetical protein